MAWCFNFKSSSCTESAPVANAVHGLGMGQARNNVACSSPQVPISSSSRRWSLPQTGCGLRGKGRHPTTLKCHYNSLTTAWYAKTQVGGPVKQPPPVQNLFAFQCSHLWQYPCKLHFDLMQRLIKILVIILVGKKKRYKLTSVNDFQVFF